MPHRLAIYHTFNLNSCLNRQEWRSGYSSGNRLFLASGCSETGGLLPGCALFLKCTDNHAVAGLFPDCLELQQNRLAVF
jgi:hypothetical protein